MTQVEVPPMVEEIDGEAEETRRSPVPALLVAVAAAITSWHLAAGVGYVLDDWFAVGHATFDGTWSAAGDEQWRARPGAGVIYGVVFGVLRGHPALAVCLLGVTSAATAVAFWHLLRRFVTERLAALAAVTWLVLPNHVSMEVWISATNISVSVLLAVVGASVMLTPTMRSRIAAAALFTLATLSYEAVLPAIAVGAVTLPWLDRRRLDLPLIGTVAVGQAAAAGWILLNWHPAKQVEKWADLSQIPAAHFGWGVLPAGPVGSIGLLVGLVGAFVVGGRLLTRRSECGSTEWCVPAGAALVVLGVAPFVRYFYAPLGAGDRFNAVSALGGALIWAAIVEMLWLRRRQAGVVLFASLIGMGLVARLDRVQLWSTAAADARAIQSVAKAQVPKPTGPVVVGPEAVQVDNVAAFLDPSNIQPALQIAYDDAGIRARMLFEGDDLSGVDPANVVDASSVIALDEVCNPVLRVLGGCSGRPEG